MMNDTAPEITVNPWSGEMATKQRVNRVSFTLPALPPSVNSLYDIIWSQRRVELKPECRCWKTDAKAHMPPWHLECEDSLICIDMFFYYDFYYKNGKLRKVDTPNMTKLLIDAIAERYGFCDSRAKRFPADSEHSPSERVVVTVTELKGETL